MTRTIRFGGALWMLMGLWACNEPLQLTGLCDTERGNICGDGGAFVRIDTGPCLGEVGGAESTCAARLDGVLADDANGCLVISERGRSSHTAVTLRGGQLELDVFSPAGVGPGDTIDAALFLFAEGAAFGQCDPLALGVDSPCSIDAHCALKLTQAGLIVAADGTVIDFRSEDVCGTEVGARAEFAEVCDDLDNDCDGIADEGLSLDGGPAVGEECTVGAGECRRVGQVICTDDGPACSAIPGQPTGEICDDADNDCDGMSDEGLPVDNCCALGTMRACGLAVGVCSMGTQTCVGEGVKGEFGACLGADGQPAVGLGELAEACNAADDDCDGEVDEDLVLIDADVITPGDQPASLGAACLALDEGCQVTGEVACGVGDAVVCVFRPVVRGEEVCDGADNDCDGTIDEGFPGLGDRCELGVGACFQQGEIACVDAQTTGCNAPIIEPDVELCADLIDDDCDGVIDEGFDDLGVACSSGTGVCQVNGEFVCSESGRSLVCDAEAGPAGAEVCDRLDNDCDGSTDEDFDTTNDPLNCGACGRDCAAIANQNVFSAEDVACAQSVCAITQCVATFEDLDGIFENGCECNAGFVDLPDETFTDRNCDGIDGDPNEAYFVSPQGSDLAPGTLDAPFATLGKALAVAAFRDKDIYLDGATYNVTDGADVPPNVAAVGLTVPPRVSIYGGYRYDGDRGWARGSQADFPTIIMGAQRVLTYRGAREEAVFLANLSIVAGPGVDHPYPTVGVSALNVGDDLVLRNVHIRTEAGIVGTTGDDGSDAASLGQAGEIGTDGDLPQQAGLGGEGGRNQGCPGTNGGVGGDGNQGAPAQAGSQGEGPEPAAGGTPGEQGADGVDGQHGTNSGGGNFVGRLDPDSLLWIPRPTAPGLSGLPGGGGGGGGGGLTNPGAGGGGGGAGGCAGSGGRAAQGGAMSVGLYVFASVVHLQNVEIIAGPGGQGGRGGHGGLGELGRLGGLGGFSPQANGNGERGGRGGDGGCGGHAGGGGGGSSFAIFRASPSRVAADIELSRFVFEDFEGRVLANQGAAAENALQSGLAGASGEGGGDRAGECGASAEDGVAGISARVGCCPVGIGANTCTQLTCD